MTEETNAPKQCPLDGVIDIISRKWSLLVINTLGNSKKARFKEILNHLNRVSPKTLSQTLKKLHKEGLVNRESFAEIPPRVVYSLTEEGIGLWKAITPLLNWTIQKGTAHGKRPVPKSCKISEEPKTKLVRCEKSS